MEKKLTIKDYQTVAELIKAFDGKIKVEQKGDGYSGKYWVVEFYEQTKVGR